MHRVICSSRLSSFARVARLGVKTRLVSSMPMRPAETPDAEEFNGNQTNRTKENEKEWSRVLEKNNSVEGLPDPSRIESLLGSYEKELSDFIRLYIRLDRSQKEQLSQVLRSGAFFEGEIEGLVSSDFEHLLAEKDEVIRDADSWFSQRGVLLEDLLEHWLSDFSVPEAFLVASWLSRIKIKMYGLKDKVSLPIPIGGTSFDSESTLMRRQLSIEKVVYTEALEELQKHKEQMKRVGLGHTVDGPLASRHVWVNWAKSLTPAIESWKGAFSNPNSEVKKPKDSTPPSDAVKAMLDLSAEDIAVVTCRAVIHHICSPMKGRHPLSAPRGSHEEVSTNVTMEDVEKGKTGGNAVPHCNFSMLSEMVGGELNRELNLRKAEAQQNELWSSKFKNKSHRRPSRPQVGVVWDKREKISVGADLVRLMKEHAFVDVEYHQAKQELAEEQQQERHSLFRLDQSDSPELRELFSKQKKGEEALQEAGDAEAEDWIAQFISPLAGHEKSFLKDLSPSPHPGLSPSPRGSLSQQVFSGVKYEMYKSDQVGFQGDSADKSKVRVRALKHRIVRYNSKAYGEICMRLCAYQQLMEVDPTTGQISAEAMARSTQLQAKLQPLIVPPQTWKGYWEGGYYTHRTPLVRWTGSSMSRHDTKVYTWGRVQAILDYLGRLPWKINTKVLSVMEEVWARDLAICDIPPRRDMKPEDYFDEASLAYRAKEGDTEEDRLDTINNLCALKAQKENAKLMSSRPTFLLKLNVARNFKSVNSGIFFPHNIDFRGRCYPIPPHLNHQGDDVCRGLLMFKESKKLGERGLFWLKVHIANLFGHDKLLFEDRVAWVDENLQQLRAAARSPLEGGDDVFKFWTGADDPWQALAACIELDAALSFPQGPENYKSGLSVHQDGSCNGLQHYAALGRDELGALAVNVKPSEKVQDVYTIVLAIVKQKVQQDADRPVPTQEDIGEKEDEEEQKGKKRVDSVSEAQLKASLARRCMEYKDSVLKRKVVKRTVMTICYGVTRLGARDQVKQSLEDELGATVAPDDIRAMAGYLSGLILSSIDEVFERAMRIKKWFDECSKILNNHGLAVAWFNPVGIPCRQPYRNQKFSSVRTGIQDITILQNSDDQPVHKVKQRMGFPPNFVHSLDGSHMLMTAERCKNENISFAAVHDSFWTHAGDVDLMNRMIREEFIKMHESQILQRLKKDFESQLGGKADLIPDLPPVGELNIEEVKDSPFFFD